MFIFISYINFNHQHLPIPSPHLPSVLGVLVEPQGISEVPRFLRGVVFAPHGELQDTRQQRQKHQAEAPLGKTWGMKTIVHHQKKGTIQWMCVDFRLYIPYGSKCLLKKYLGYDLGGQVPSQTVFGSIGIYIYNYINIYLYNYNIYIYIYFRCF